MARILILCGRYPADLSSGSDLRFQNLCKQLAQRNECFLVCLGEVPAGIDPLAHIGVRDFETLPLFPGAGKSFLRHLRLSNTHFLRRSVPTYLAHAQGAIKRLVAKWEVDAVICLVPPAAEMLLPIGMPKLLDFCDSRTLTLRRMLQNRGDEMSARERLSTYVKYFRERQRERSLVRRFDRTTTISGADRKCLLQLSGAHPKKVVVIPNGVASEALDLDRGTGNRRRSVVFWGNLDFPPNWTAVDYFNREIFLPHLAAHDVEWHIIGKGDDETIRELSRHPLIHLHGFVDDLFEEISSHGVMINPMVEGSGLKNKVLEAFACRLPVVSTTMGIEAVGARVDEHFLVADNAAAFAGAVIRCLEDEDLAATLSAAARQFVEDHFEWRSIGSKLDDLVKEIAQ
jgi:glycosyltransferase involved in cell wall biosynthesis